MSRAPSPGTFDPDLDTPSRPPIDSYRSIAECQRLIANPALVFLVWVMAYLVIRQGLMVRHLGIFLSGLLLAVVPLFLGQYHCLDCGATGWALRAARHACPQVLARRHDPTTAWLRIPRLRTQFKLWIGLLLLALLFYAILGSPRR